MCHADSRREAAALLAVHLASPSCRVCMFSSGRRDATGLKTKFHASHEYE